MRMGVGCTLVTDKSALVIVPNVHHESIAIAQS